VIEFPILGDSSVEDLLGKVIGTNVPTNGDGVSSKCFDLLNNKLSFFCIEAAEVVVSIEPRHREKEVSALADYNLRTLFGKDDGSAPSDTLSQTSESAYTRNIQKRVQLTCAAPGARRAMSHRHHRKQRYLPVMIATSPASKPRE
jgi:hypothetical protein